MCILIFNNLLTKKKTLFHNNGSSLRSFFREVKMMTQLHHPNILLFMGICVDKKHRYIITELMSRGSAFDLIHSKKLAGQVFNLLFSLSFTFFYYFIWAFF